MSTACRAAATTVATPSDREIVITRVVHAPRRLVFDAWTSPEHLPYWMLGPTSGWPMPVCEIDLRPGGKWCFVWRRADGAELAMRGVYREVTPPERLVYTESWGDRRVETLNTVLLAEEDGNTTITCTVRYPSNEARDTALRAGMNAGGSGSFENFAEYLRAMI